MRDCGCPVWALRCAHYPDDDDLFALVDVYWGSAQACINIPRCPAEIPNGAGAFHVMHATGFGPCQLRPFCPVIKGNGVRNTGPNIFAFETMAEAEECFYRIVQAVERNALGT